MKPAKGKRLLYRSHSSNSRMAEKPNKSEQLDWKPGEGDQSPKLDNPKSRKKKSSRAMSFDIKSLTAALKHPSFSGETSTQPDALKTPPKQKKTYTDSKHPSSSTSDIEDELHDQQFLIHYLGHVDLRNPGLEEIVNAVNKLYTSSKPNFKTMTKSILSLNRDGIHIKQEVGLDVNRNDSTESTDSQPKESSTPGNDLYKPRRILYCGVDKQHQRVFSFNYQHGARAEKIQLHVLVCKTKDDAKNVAKYLAQLFKRISKDMHKKEREDKKQHQEGLTRSKTKSNSNITKSNSNVSSHTYQNLTYKTTHTEGTDQDGSCSPCGSKEWLPDKERERIGLSMA